MYRFIFVLICSITTLILLHPIHNFDIWWHLDSGLWMLDKQQLLDHEIRSFSAENSAWVNVHYSFQIILGLFYKLANDWGLFLFKFLLVALLVILLAKNSLQKIQQSLPFIATFLLLGPFLVGHLLLRPHLVSYCFYALSILLIRFPFKPGYFIYYLMLMLLWSNTHLSAIVGAVTFSLHVMSHSLERNKWWQGGLMSVALLITPIINPFAFDALAQLLNHGSGLATLYIEEWDPPSFKPLFFVLILLYVSALFFRLLTFRLAEFFLIVFFAFQYSQHLRFEGELVLLLFAPIVSLLTIGYEKLQKVQTGVAVLFFSVLIGLMLKLLPWPTLLTESRYRTYPIVKQQYPLHTVEILKKIALDQEKPLNMFVPYRYGGFISFHTNGKFRIQIDGRTPLVFDDYLLLEQNIGLSNAHAFAKLLKLYDYSALLFRKSDVLPVLLTDPDWQLVAYDEVSYLYLKKALAEQYQLKAIDYHPYRNIKLNLEQQKITQNLLTLMPENALLYWNLAQNRYGKNRLAYLAQAYRLNPNKALSKIEYFLALRQLKRPEAKPLFADLPREFSLNSPLYEIQLAFAALEYQQFSIANIYVYPQNITRRVILDSQFEIWVIRCQLALFEKNKPLAKQSLEFLILLATPTQQQMDLINRLSNEIKKI